MTAENYENIRLLRVRQIVKPDGLLPICRSSFYNLVRKGTLSPGIRFGRSRFWRASEITSLINSLDGKVGGDV